MTQKELRSEFEQKVRRGIFNPVTRHLSGPDAEDRLAEGIALVYEMYARYGTDKNKVLDDGILVHACKQRAVDLRRRFVRDDAQPARDVMHPGNYNQGKVEVFRIDGLVDPETGEFIAQDEVEALVPGLATALQVNPQRDIISAVDLERFLSGLTEKDQTLLEMRMAGATLKETAEKVGLSISTVFARLKALGLQLADRAGLAVAGTTPTMA